MQSSPPQKIYLSPGQLALDLALIATGSVLCAVAINGILLPNRFVTGGITGLALLIHDRVPSLGVGSLYALINIPLFALAWMAVGRRFFFYSILGALALSAAVAYVHVPLPPVEDKLLSALLAGILGGGGTGIVLRSSGSQGGIDILSIMLLRRFSISIGNTILAVNAVVLLFTALTYSLDAVLYTLIVLYVAAKMVNLVVTGLSQRKAVIIISNRWQEISREILKDIRRGVTIIEGQGGYSGARENILYTVITFREIGQLKRLVQNLDPQAFVVISDTLEVVNYRIGNQPHW
ncbi:MAG: YitT family protein [Thermodesulfobacteriota bacterium]